jgi:glycosyltransferase involved in cell wall biosynthesis
MTAKLYSVAAVGNVLDKSTFSGTPYHFFSAARSLDASIQGWSPDLAALTTSRKAWNIGQLLRLRRPGGYQFSSSFEQKLTSQIPTELLATSVISFNQHFPSPHVIHRHGGRISYYIDATTTQLFDRYGVARHVNAATRDYAIRTEREWLNAADHVFTMQQWSADSVINDYGVAASKVNVILPGANIEFAKSYQAIVARVNQYTADRPLVLGFVGKDWQRKGLLTLAAVRDELARRGHHVTVRCAGYAPDTFSARSGFEFAGFIDKYKDYTSFISFLESCDIGCLFSEAEFSSISILEFISTGRPVSGFLVDGMGDLFMPELSIRHSTTDSISLIADRFERFIVDTDYRSAMQNAAVGKSEHVRWPRAVNEIMKVLRHD